MMRIIAKQVDFSASILILLSFFFSLSISLALFFKISPEVIPSWRSFLKKVKEKAFTCHETKISKPEVATVVVMIVLPLLFDWIPFTTNTYGQVSTWCWIRTLDHNCTNTAGWWERFWLWDVPFGLGFFLILILLVATLCLFINLLTLHAETVWPLQVVYTMPLLWG